jgi:AraC family transcriptional regulator
MQSGGTGFDAGPAGVTGARPGVGVRRLPAGRFFGTSKVARSAGAFRLTESAYSLGAVLPRHAHELGLFVLVLSGRYDEIRASTETHERGPMSLLYLPSDLPHEERHTAPGRRFMVEVPASFVQRIGEAGLDLTRPHDLSGTSAVGVARQLYREFCNPDAMSTLAIEALTLQLIVHIRRDQTPTAVRIPRYVRQAQELLRANFTEGVTVVALAREVGVNPVHLTKAFRRWTGRSISDYVRAHRLDFACREMLRDDRTLFDIAIAAGYYDQSHFCRAFRRHTGMTPGDFRRQSRRDPARPIRTASRSPHRDQ